MKIHKWLFGCLLFLNIYLKCSYVTVDIEIKDSKITIELETESELRKNTTITGKSVDAIRDALFQAPNEGVKFKYDNQASNYGGAINKITDQILHEEVSLAFAAFQEYVAKNMRNVIADGTKFNAKVDIYSKSPLAAANKDVYKQVMKLGKVLGIDMPDPDASWYSPVCKVLGNKWVKRAIYVGLAVGGIALLYNKWGQWSNIIGTRTEQCGTGIETAGKGIGAIGSGIAKSGRSIKETGTWIKTPRPSKTTAPVPTRGPLVNASTIDVTPPELPVPTPPQFTPTPEIFENMPTPPNTPTP